MGASLKKANNITKNMSRIFRLFSIGNPGWAQINVREFLSDGCE
jgi:hypothetical protein